MENYTINLKYDIYYYDNNFDTDVNLIQQLIIILRDENIEENNNYFLAFNHIKQFIAEQHEIQKIKNSITEKERYKNLEKMGSSALQQLLLFSNNNENEYTY